MFKLPSAGILNSVLDFYAYIGDSTDNYQNDDDYYMPTNNPYTSNPSELTAAVIAAAPTLAAQIAAASIAATGQALATESAGKTARTTQDRDFTVKAWTGTPSDHVACAASNTRIQTKIINRHNQRMFISIGAPGSKNFESYTEFIEPNGSYISTDDDRLLPILLYLAAGKQQGQASITEFSP